MAEAVWASFITRLAPFTLSTFPPLPVMSADLGLQVPAAGEALLSALSVCHALSTGYVFSKVFYLEYPGFKVHHHSISQQASVGRCFLH